MNFSSDSCDIVLRAMKNDKSLFQRLKEIFSLKRLVWFTLISGLFLVFYTPHLKFEVEIGRASCRERV